MSNARETIALRNHLQLWLEPRELRDIAWPAIAKAADEALTRGWTGNELARWCLADLAGNPPHDTTAVILTTLRSHAAIAPPRDNTPTPEPFDNSELAQRRKQRAANPSEWANRIRREIGGH